MDSIVAIPSKIVEWLNTQPELSDISFFTEFPPASKAVPLKKAIVAVGIEEMSIVDKFVANDEGILEKQEYCRSANITARLSICVPYSYGGTACHDYFTKIIDALTFRTDLEILESGCHEIESDRDTSALVCHGWFKILADFCPGTIVDDNFTSIFDKSFICGSHVSNNDIHVTAQDKELWNNSLISGVYVGTGASSFSVNLGFKPRLVFVFATDYPFMTVNFSNSTVKSQMGLATEDYSSGGITVTSNGFRVSKTTISNVTVSYNEVAMVYGYVAFK